MFCVVVGSGATSLTGLVLVGLLTLAGATRMPWPALRDLTRHLVSRSLLAVASTGVNEEKRRSECVMNAVSERVLHVECDDVACRGMMEKLRQELSK